MEPQHRTIELPTFHDWSGIMLVSAYAAYLMLKIFSIPNSERAKFMSASDLKEQTIRELAYELWQRSGSPRGEEDHFWYEAERMLRAEEGIAASEKSKVG